MVASRLVGALAPEVGAGLVEVDLLTETDDHLYQPGLLYLALGRATAEELHRRESQLIAPEVHLTIGRAASVDTDRCEVRTADGRVLPYDYLVLATGSGPAWSEIPGLAEGGYEFYTERGALRLQERLNSFTGGRIVLTVGVPHKCPVAPLEFVFLLDEVLRARGIREKAELVYTYPLGRAHSIETVAPWAEEALHERHIELETFVNMETVDPEARVVHTMESEEIPYDLLVSVPPHQGAAFLAAPESTEGLTTPGNWIRTDRHTLQVTGTENVYAVGDATDLPISKAGSTAHYEAEAVTEMLVARLRGGSSSRLYDGKVYCFIESGREEATYIAFDYEHPPRPVPPSRLLHLFKLAFNRSYWLMPQGIV